MRYENIIGSFALAAGLFVGGGAMAAGNVDAGKAIFGKTCQNCHSVDVGMNKVGPSLDGIIGPKAGAVQGFDYWTPLRTRIRPGRSRSSTAICPTRAARCTA